MARHRRAEGYLTKEEAAEMLHLRRYDIDRMVRQGVLIPRYLNGGHLMSFRVDDVQALLTSQGDRDTDIWAVKSIALQALSAARRAEQRLAELYERLGLDLLPLPRDAGYITELHQEAKKEFRREAVWNRDWLKFWSGVFFAFDEVYLGLVTRVTGDDEPWKCFLDLANHITRTLHTTRHSVSPHTVRVFLASREHLRYVSYLHCQQSTSNATARSIFGTHVTAVSELEALLDEAGNSARKMGIRRVKEEPS